ncbi:hypothetical protein NEOKW01_1198 [Nematocida sp. AWRm80]|nr:hypothetical protein NEOKW01_1198 [Nematocida sp. AWRm80]
MSIEDTTIIDTPSDIDIIDSSYDSRVQENESYKEDLTNDIDIIDNQEEQKDNQEEEYNQDEEEYNEQDEEEEQYDNEQEEDEDEYNEQEEEQYDNDDNEQEDEEEEEDEYSNEEQEQEEYSNKQENEQEEEEDNNEVYDEQEVVQEHEIDEQQRADFKAIVQHTFRPLVSNEEYERILDYSNIRVNNREKGYNVNNKPLLWKEEIEEYTDELEPIKEPLVIKEFRERIEQRNTNRNIINDQYYNHHTKEIKQAIPEHELRDTETLKNTPNHWTRDTLREVYKEQSSGLYHPANIHVSLKYHGYTTESFKLFSVISKEYILQRRIILEEIDLVLNTISDICNVIHRDNRYKKRCADLIGIYPGEMSVKK